MMLSTKSIPVVPIEANGLYDEISEEGKGCSENTLSFQSDRYHRLLAETKELQNRAKEQLKKAEKEAEELYYQAREEIARWEEEASQRGYEQGFSEGSEKGFEQGLEEGKAQGVLTYQQEVERLKSAWLSVNDQIKTDLEAVGPQLVELMVQAVGKITLQKFQSDYGLLQECLQEMILSLGKRQRCLIQVSPSKVEEVEAFLPQLKELTPDVRLQVLANSSLNEADCLIETELETIDLTLDAQLETLKEVWLQAVKL